jgi:hypothetical protein
MIEIIFHHMIEIILTSVNAATGFEKYTVFSSAPFADTQLIRINRDI